MKDSTKISNLITSQLPSYISEEADYSAFVSFLEAYYEWMEEQGQVYGETKNLLEYQTIDSTLDEFIDYFYNEFMPSFPKDIICDRRKLLKFSREIYQTKGTISSYKFLFKSLYGSDCEIFETKDFILIPSSGVWFSPKSVKLRSSDPRFLNIEDYFIAGETSTSVAKIERVISVGDKLEVFLSDIKRTFAVSEYIRVVDYNFKELYFDEDGNVVSEGQGDILRARLLSPISSVDINPKNRGNFYQTGNPVVFYNGLDAGGIGAVATVGEVTPGYLLTATTNPSSSGNYGYRIPYTKVVLNPDPQKYTIIDVSEVDTSNTIPLNYIIKDGLDAYKDQILYCDASTGYSTNNQCDYGFSTLPKANSNTRMSDAFSFSSFDTHPIKSLIITRSSSFSAVPALKAVSTYETDKYLDTGAPYYDDRYTFGSTYECAELPLLGILGPVKVQKNPVTGYLMSGTSYEVGDELSFSGSVGSAAFANVSSVGSNGEIISVSYYQKANVPAPLGGFGYYASNLPKVTIQPKTKTANVTINSRLVVINSASPLNNVRIGQTITGNGIPSNSVITTIYTGNNSVLISNNATATYISNTYNLVGTGASLYVDCILGEAAQLSSTTDRIGSITTINVSEYGEDYNSEPRVSLKIQDIAVSNLNITKLPVSGDLLYQGNIDVKSNYKSYVDSITLVENNIDPLLSKYIIRSFNYNKLIDVDSILTLRLAQPNTANTYTLNIEKTYTFPIGYQGTDTSHQGVVTFGDGSAKANAKFLNGLKIGKGKYISDRGQLSSFSILQNKNYNEFSYILSVEKEISKYRNWIYELLHPAGSRLIGQARINSYVDHPTDFENYFSNKLNDTELQYIFEVIADESYNTLIFDSSISKYGQWTSNNTITLREFPSTIFVGQIIEGYGIPDNSIIRTISLDGNYITISNNCISNTTLQEFTVRDNAYYPPTYVYTTSAVNGNTIIGSNTIQINGDYSSILSGISIGQTVTSEPVTISANVTYSSNTLTSVKIYGNVRSGQIISGRYIPGNTSIISYYPGNSTILMSNTATGNVISNTIHYEGGSPTLFENYIQLYNIPSNTKIIGINNYTITLSNRGVMDSNAKLFQFFDESNNIISALVETGISL